MDISFYGMPVCSQQWVCKREIFLQVDALYEERRRKLQDLQKELNWFAGVTTDTHLRVEVDAHLTWIETTGLTVTLREIEGKKNGIRRIVRLPFQEH